MEHFHRPIDQATHSRSHSAILMMLALATLLPSLAVSSVNLTLPIIATQLEVSFSQIQWLTIAYMLALTSTLVVIGKVIDAKGQKNVFIIGLLIFVGAATALALTENLYYLIMLRAIQGVGGAMLIAVNIVIASNFFDKNKIGFAIGMIGSMSAVGTGTGPILASFLIEYWNWQSVFLINIPIAIVTLVFSLFFLPSNEGNLNQAINYKAAFMFFMTVTSLTITLKTMETSLSSFTLAFSMLSIAIFTLFIIYEKQTYEPLFDVEKLKEPVLITCLITNFFISSVVIISLIIGPFYLTLGLDLSIVDAGFVMTASPITVAIFAFLAGRLSNKVNLKNLQLTGVILITLGAIWMTQISTPDGVICYIIGLVIIGSGYATFNLANNTLAMLKVDPNNKGLFSGVLNLSRNLGLMIGASLSSNVFSIISGLGKQIQPDPNQLAHSVNMVYCFALLMLFITLIILFINKQANDKR